MTEEYKKEDLYLHWAGRSKRGREKEEREIERRREKEGTRGKVIIMVVLP